MLKLRIMQVSIVMLGKIMAVLYGLFGIIIGLFITLARIFGVDAGGETGLQSLGLAAVVILPILYALMGALSGAVSGFFFNLATKWVGPLEIDVADNQA